MILVDSTVLMYAAGTVHPHKMPCVEFLERVASADVAAVVDSEVLREILHRYRAINRWSDGGRGYDLTRRIFSGGGVVPVTADVLDGARGLLDLHPGLTAGAALHGAVVQTHSLDAICSYDRSLDRIAGLKRMDFGMGILIPRDRK